MFKITAEDLNQLARRRDAEALFPELMRRLILATVSPAKLQFPSGESIFRSGFDGELLAAEPSTYFDSGFSRWELTTQKSSITGKANDDYAKRTEAIPKARRVESEFIFVSLARWSQKQKWEDVDSEEDGYRPRLGEWRKVRALDADDLEQWLDETPGVALWLAWRIGKHPSGAESLVEFWDNWRRETAPALNAEVLLAGRDQERDRLSSVLRGEAAIQTIKASTREESVAFLAAYLDSCEDDEREFLQSRAVVVRDQDAWRHLVHTHSNLILVPLVHDHRSTAALEKSHHVVVPVLPDAAPDPATIRLFKQPDEELGSVLEACGVENSRALVHRTKSALAAIRRELHRSPASRTPIWAQSDLGVDLIPYQLLGSWRTSNEADCSIVQRLSNCQDHETDRLLTKASQLEDPPLERVGDLWRWVSRQDSWRLLARYVTPGHLREFSSRAVEILGEYDPRYDLEPNDWMFAELRGKKLSYSEDLRRGVATTLAALGSFQGEGSFLPEFHETASGVVRELLEADEWRTWVSISSYLPLLAEAAPEVFLEAVERILGDQEIIAKLFQEGGMLGPSSAHTGLLWALEICAWPSEYLTQVTLILGELAGLDPGGRLANRPDASLQDIFSIPQTHATQTQRFLALDRLYERQQQVAWAVWDHLIPVTGRAYSPTSSGEWRGWGGVFPPERTWAEFHQQVNLALERLLRHAGIEGDRWTGIVKKLRALSPDNRTRVLERLRSLCVEGSLSAEARSCIEEGMRTLLSDHRSFPEADWSLPEDVLDEIEEVYGLYVLDDPVHNFLLLGKRHPALPSGGRRPWQEREKEIEEKRSKSARELLDSEGAAQLLARAESVEDIHGMGWAIGGTVQGDDEGDLLLDLNLGSPTSEAARLRAGIVGRMRKMEGWVARQWNRIDDREAKLRFLLALPLTIETLDLVKAGGHEEDYWAVVSSYWGQAAEEHIELVLRALLQAGRPFAAIDLVGLYLHEKDRKPIDTDLLIGILLAALDIGSPSNEEPHPHDTLLDTNVAAMLDAIAESSEVATTQLTQLEWAYLPLLEDRRPPKTLHAELAQNPVFFAEVISWVYKPNSGEQEDEMTEERQIRARLGLRLLRKWRTIPGLHIDGSTSLDELKSWIHEARRICAESDRAAVGDIHIGQLLSHAPLDSDGTWPVLAVREAIEEVGARDLERGVSQGLFNQRGAYMKGRGEGGDQERVLAANYSAQADALAGKWPRTAKVLRDLGRTYEHYGLREDRLHEEWD